MNALYMWNRNVREAVKLVAGLLVAASANAHTGSGDVAGGFAAGFVHPLFGLDHLAAMVAVGIWGAQLGQPAIWVLPIAFPLVMALGGAVGVLGLPIPGVEIGIAFSAIVLGAMIAVAARPPLAIAAFIVAFFAVCHGFSHGVQLTASTSAIAYASGFVIATGALHGVGILFGTIQHWPPGSDLLRLAGGLIAATGVWFLLPQISGA